MSKANYDKCCQLLSLGAEYMWDHFIALPTILCKTVESRILKVTLFPH